LNKIKPHILILPRWYPNIQDIQLGIFIKEHACLMADKYDISVINVQLNNEINTNFKIEVNSENGVKEITVYFKALGLFKKWVHFFRYQKAQKKGFGYLKQPVDLCHVHVPIRPAFLALKLKRKVSIPFIVTEHWSGHLNGLFKAKSPLYKAFYNYVLKKAGKITTVSEILSQKFKDNTGFDSTVIPNYIQRDLSTLPEHELQDFIHVITVSDLYDPTKNLTGLIYGFSEALSKQDNLRLTIIGGGPDQNKLEDLVNQLKLESYITFTGRLNHQDVLKALKKCDFYLCNSNFETFGMTVAEALYAGKPVISTKCGGPEAFVNSENGMLIQVNDEEELPKVIVQMANSYQSYNGTKISEAIESKYGKSAVKESWGNLYEAILHG